MVQGDGLLLPRGGGREGGGGAFSKGGIVLTAPDCGGRYRLIINSLPFLGLNSFLNSQELMARPAGSLRVTMNFSPEFFPYMSEILCGVSATAR